MYSSLLKTVYKTGPVDLPDQLLKQQSNVGGSLDHTTKDGMHKQWSKTAKQTDNPPNGLKRSEAFESQNFQTKTNTQGIQQKLLKNCRYKKKIKNLKRFSD